MIRVSPWCKAQPRDDSFEGEIDLSHSSARTIPALVQLFRGVCGRCLRRLAHGGTFGHLHSREFRGGGEISLRRLYHTRNLLRPPQISRIPATSALPRRNYTSMVSQYHHALFLHYKIQGEAYQCKI